MRAGRRRGVAAVVSMAAMALAIGAPATSTAGAVEGRAAAPAQSPPLPTASLSSTDLHLGDEVTLTGSGCIDPDTGSSEGLTISADRFDAASAGFPRAFDPTPVAPDGTFSLTATVKQPLRAGRQQLVLVCVDPDRPVNFPLPGEGPGAFSLVRFPAIDVTVTSPPLDGLTIVDGVASFKDPCRDNIVSNSRQATLFAADGTPRVLPYLDGAASRLRYEVPADLAPGRYLIDYVCGNNRSYPINFQRQPVTLADRRVPATSTTSGPSSGGPSTTSPSAPKRTSSSANTAPATGARPRPGSASYTG